MKTYDEVIKEINTLKKENETLKKQVHDLKYGNQERWKKEKELAENYLQLFGYDGIQIPLDKDMKKAVGVYLSNKIHNIIENKEDTTLLQAISLKILRNKKYFIDTFKPIIREIIEDMNFNIALECDEDE